MQVPIRLSAGLIQLQGNPRFAVTLPDEATVADLFDHLQNHYPELQPKLNIVVPIIAGKPASKSQSLIAGQEVALLLPAAGG